MSKMKGEELIVDRTSKKTNIIAFSLISIIVVLILFYLFRIWNILSYGSIYDGIYYKGINISGYKQDDAKKLLYNKVQAPVDKKSLTLIYKDKTWKLKYKDLKLTYNYQQAVNDAYRIGRNGSIFTKMADISSTKSNKVNLPVKIYKDTSYVEKLLANIENSINNPKQEPSMQLVGDSFVIRSGHYGIKVDKNKVRAQILSEVNNMSEDSIYIPVVADPVKHSTQELYKVKDMLGSYQTKAGGTENRIHNIILAASKLNTTVIYPGEIFSLNKALGPRTSKNGFRTAPVIINNKVEQDEGGGVCQVATTLYDAVIRSELAVEQRAHHTIPSSYCPIGQDATIAGNYIDFKFRNSSPYPIYIKSWVGDGYLNCDIYGYKQNPKEVVYIESKIVSKTPAPKYKYVVDKTLPKGKTVQEKGSFGGYVVEVYRIVKVNGKEVRRKRLSVNKYLPIQGIMRVGE